MITLIAKLVAKSGQEDILKEECLKMVGLVKENEPNCIMYVPHIDSINPAVIVVVEKYTDQIAFDDHFNTPYFQALVNQFGKLLAIPPDLQVLLDLI